MLRSPLEYDPVHQRLKMVAKWKTIRDPMVLHAMSTVPRHLFMPEAFRGVAYDDHPFPIGHGQTISQPYIVAKMSQYLQASRGMTVLEVGTGSGYQAAVLAAMGLTVFTVERLEALYFATRNLFQELGLRTIRMKIADGTLGWKEHAPYDRILVTAGGPDIPTPLVEQLADPGIMVIPMGVKRGSQRLVRITKKDGRVTAKAVGQVAFVDLVGDYGWQQQ